MTLNPFLWLHQRISGSPHTHFVVVGAFAGLVLLFYSLSHYMSDPASSTPLDAIWLGIISAAQCMFVLLVAPGAIRKAVQKDFQSGMMESHRLTPMTNLRIVLGYLSGPPLAALTLFGVGLIFGGVFSSLWASSIGVGMAIGAKVVVGGWYYAQAMLLTLALTIAVVSLLIGIASGGKSNILGIMIAISVFGGWMVVAFVPGLALLTGVMSAGGFVSFVSKGTLVGDPAAIATAAVLQLGLSAILIWACCRKLRKPEYSVFSVMQAFVLLGLWAVALIAGMKFVGQYSWLVQHVDGKTDVQIVASTLAFAFVGLFAILSAAVERFHLDRALALGGPHKPGHAFSLNSVALLLALMSVLVLIAMSAWAGSSTWAEYLEPAGRRIQPFVFIFLALALSNWLDFCWLYRAIALGKRVRVPLLLSIGVLKVAPVALDEGIRRSLMESGEVWAAYGYLSACSPVGTVMKASVGGSVLWFGLLVQAAIAGVATYAARRARQRLRTPLAPELQPVHT